MTTKKPDNLLILNLLLGATKSCAHDSRFHHDKSLGLIDVVMGYEEHLPKTLLKHVAAASTRTSKQRQKMHHDLSTAVRLFKESTGLGMRAQKRSS